MIDLEEILMCALLAALLGFTLPFFYNWTYKVLNSRRHDVKVTRLALPVISTICFIGMIFFAQMTMTIGALVVFLSIYLPALLGADRGMTLYKRTARVSKR